MTSLIEELDPQGKLRQLQQQYNYVKTRNMKLMQQKNHMKVWIADLKMQCQPMKNHIKQLQKEVAELRAHKDGKDFVEDKFTSTHDFKTKHTHHDPLMSLEDV